MEKIERIIAFFLIIILLPIFVIISLIIMFESKGKPIFVQERIGKNKKKFNIYKFRTMYIDGEKRLKEFFEKNPEAIREWEMYRKLKNDDPRITKFGKYLRKFSLDELPQLFNILKGEMSFVGPRPYLAEEVERFESEDEIIFNLKPGLTGPWQVGGRNKLTFKERVEIDKNYIKQKTLKGDLIILLKTFGAIISKDGAY
ncbi:MAG: sugar transferase [candidate division WOR-3 bacterium]